MRCVFLLLLITSSFAQTPCNGTSEYCATLEFKKAEAELNAMFKKALQTMQAAGGDAGDRERLVRAQRAWVKFREAGCEAEYHLFAGGSGGPAGRLVCKTELNRARTKELEARYVER